MRKSYLINSKLLSACIAIALFATLASCEEKDIDKETEEEVVVKLRTDLKLGAFFFGAWTTGSGHIENQNLKTLFPKRESVWGWDNCKSNENISAQIDSAKAVGLSFFAFDWYIGTSVIDVPNFRLNTSMEAFKRVNNRRMQYCIVAVNEPVGNTYAYDQTVWKRATEVWKKELSTSSTYYDDYLKIDNKPVLILFDASSLLISLGGWDADSENTTGRKAAVKKVRELVDKLKQDLNNNISLVMANSDIGLSTELGCDIVTNYNNHTIAYKSQLGNQYGDIMDKYTSPPKWDRDILYNADKSQTINFRTSKEKYPEAVAHMKLIPTATLNWDKRSSNIGKNKVHPYFDNFNEDVVYQSVSNMVEWLDNANDANATKEKIGFIFAWNEYNEGAWLTPSVKGMRTANGIKRALTIK